MSAATQGCDLLRRVLEVVVHRDDRVELGRPYARENGVVLTVVAGQVDRLDLLMLMGQPSGNVPGVVRAAVDDQDHLVLVRSGVTRREKPIHESWVVWWPTDSRE